MIAMSLVLLLASLVAAFAGFSLLAAGPAIGMVPAFLLFVVAAVLFSAGAVIEGSGGCSLRAALVGLLIAGCTETRSPEQPPQVP